MESDTLKWNFYLNISVYRIILSTDLIMLWKREYRVNLCTGDWTILFLGDL